MSNYRALAIHPVTGAVALADFLDDCFGHHEYGVRFEGEIKVYRANEVERGECKTVIKPGNIEVYEFAHVLRGLEVETGKPYPHEVRRVRLDPDGSWLGEVEVDGWIGTHWCRFERIELRRDE